MRLLSRVSARMAICLVLFLSAFGVAAQTTLTATGSPKNAALFPVEHGFINLGNGNLHLEIPIGAIPQRGNLTLPSALVYDSSLWEVTDGGSSLVWTPNANGGWSIQYNRYYGAAANVATVACPSGLVNINVYTSISWTDTGATAHVFPIKTIEANGCSDSSYPDTPSGSAYATDASGYYATVTNYTLLKVWDSNGTQVVNTEVPSAGPTGNPQVDRNGNEITYDAEGEVASDSLGHTPIKETVVSTDPSGLPEEIYLDVPVAQSEIARYIIQYETIEVKTAFNVAASNFVSGQTGNVAESAATFRVIQSIELPDGSKYSFQYDQACANEPCGTGAVTSYGLLKSMTLPHGGTVSYGFTSDSYAGYKNAARWASSHTGSDGATTFALTNQGSYTPTTETGGYSCQKLQNVVGTAIRQIDYVFSSCNGAIQPMKVVSAPVGSTAIADSLVLYSYDFSHPCQNSACAGAQWIVLTGTTTVLPTTGTIGTILAGTRGTGLISDMQFGYTTAGSGKITSTKQWNYYSGTYPVSLPDTPSGTLARETDTVYGYTSNYALLPTDIEIKDGTGTVWSETSYTYDESGHLSTSPSGVPNHSNSLAASLRGNVTTVQRIAHGAASVTALKQSMNYDDTGALVSITDANTNLSKIGYDATDTYPEVVTRPTTGTVTHVSKFTRDFNTGEVLTQVDENNQTTTFNYDSIGRLSTVAFSNAGTPVTLQTITYPSVNETDAVTLQSEDSSSTVAIDTSVTVDGYGRPSSSNHSGVTSETSYDAEGRIASVTNPHLSTPSTTDGTVKYTYDELNRVKTVTAPDQKITTYTYAQNVVTVTDPLSHKRQYVYDAFGQLGSTLEPNAGNSLAWTTQYLRNAVGALTEIDQEGGTTDTTQWRKRLFSYDGLGRLTSTTTPEQGKITYAFDSVGNVTRVQNQNSTNNGVTYTYDSLNRVLTKAVDGSTTYTYTYDAQDASGDSYGHGRLTSISDTAGNASRFRHDPFGNVIYNQECRSTSCSPSYVTQAKYDYQGNLISLTYPDTRVIEWVYDLFNRPTESVYTFWNGAATDIPFMVNGTYFPTGQLQDVIDGSGVELTASYNNDLNLTSLVYNNNGVPLESKTFTWDVNAKNLLSITDAAAGRTQTFTYDQLDRLATAKDTGTTSSATNPSLPKIPATNETYTIDAWGNLQQSGSFSFTLGFTANNQINSSSYQYDSAGNLTKDGLGSTYTYRADGHQTATNGIAYTYDGQEQRIQKGGAQPVQYFYFGGKLIATRNTSTGAWSDLLYGAHGILGTVAGTIDANPVYRVGDHLNSLAQTTDDNGNVLGSTSFSPFGQTSSNSNSDIFPFAEYERDSTSGEAGNDHTTFRQYASAQGRWLSPDPSAGSYNYMDPQSFNRYSYALNQPLTLIDSLGLDSSCPDGDICLQYPGGGGSGPDDCGGYCDDGGGSGGGGAGGDYGGGLVPSIAYGNGDLNAGGYSQREGYQSSQPGATSAIDSNKLLDWTQSAFRLAGLLPIPVLGDVFNVLNVGIDLARGNYGAAAMDGIVAAAGLIPGGAAVARGAQAIEETAVIAEEGVAAVEATEQGVDVALTYMPGWSPAQIAEADAKVEALSNAETTLTQAERSGTSAASRYRQSGGTIGPGQDVDHVIDLQLGGSDTIGNMRPLDSSVNRSLGSQIYQQTKNLPIGTKLNRFTIGPR